ncbi:thiamine ABC transporter substrate-binding protein [Treponema zioleckii]|uniref:thiamine ABC transporter substrate-binding protein n=1 Tax=Treponema zioleckii TaxID=331680 RepID=UPI00168B7EBF|nr:thiamine ABC transporter substrate binding subunit [Treponema zioleckii]
MKKNHILKILSIFVSSILFSSIVLGCHSKKDESQAKASAENKEITVYAYDSFLGEWGPGPEIKKVFEEKTGLTVNFVEFEDAISVMSKAILEKDNPIADVIIGLDNNIAHRAIEADILESYKPSGADELIPQNLVSILGGDWKITPYDYSHFAIIYDTKSTLPAPESLDDLKNEIYRNSLILMDPRTSTPGLGFVAWTVATYGENYLDFWKELKPNILAMTPGWSSGYGMFEKGEAPMVISYTTSPAAGIEYNGGTTFKTLIFDDGHPIQVEGAAIIKNAKNLEGAKKFMDFLISDEAQKTLPLTQWMYPANKNVALPPCYEQGAAIPEKTLTPNPKELENAVEKIMETIK